MEKYAKLKSLVISIEDDFNKFYDKGNKAAGTRARKAMQDVKVLAQDIRKEIQETKNADA
ncbi:MAG: histone H1 [Bacteroidota bacterium]